jgi:hypothetical protein
MIDAMKNDSGREISVLFGLHGNKLIYFEKGMKEDTCTHFLKAYNETHRIEIV